MSVFLATAPAPQPQSPAQTTTPEPVGQTAAPSGAVSAEAVKPTEQSNAGNTARDGTAFAGKGAGAGAQDGPVKAAGAGARPQDATPDSILNAKMADETAEPDKTDTMREETYFERMRAPRDEAENMLPKPPVKLPDPVPTSPVLKRSDR